MQDQEAKKQEARVSPVDNRDNPIGNSVVNPGDGDTAPPQPPPKPPFGGPPGDGDSDGN